jgi:hypothetical protein
MFWVDNRLSPQATGHGIRGDGKGVNGLGVWGNSDSGGTGVFGNGAVGVKATGTTAAAMFVGTNPLAPRFRSDSHARGEIDIDANGNLWMCIASGTPGTWRKLAGPQTSGAFHATLPARAYDSRFFAGPISSGENQLIQVSDGYDTTTGVLNAPNVVPIGATAIAGNLTITATTRQGFLTLAPGFLTGITASTINWNGDSLDIANGFIVQLDSNRQVRVFAGGGGRTDFIIDVAGYFM